MSRWWPPTPGAPQVRLHRRRRARGPARWPRVTGRVSHPHPASMAGAVAMPCPLSASRLARPALRGGGDAGGRRVGDRGAGRALARPDGARRHRAGAHDSGRRRRGPDPHRGRQGQQRRRRAGGGAAAARGGARGRRDRPGAAGRADRRRRIQSGATPGSATRAPRAGWPGRLRRRGRRAAGHRVLGRAPRAGGRRDRRDQRAGRAGRGLRRALGRRRLHRRGGRRGRARHPHRHLPRPQGGPARGARRLPLRERWRWWRSACRAGRLRRRRPA